MLAHPLATLAQPPSRRSPTVCHRSGGRPLACLLTPVLAGLALGLAPAAGAATLRFAPPTAYPTGDHATSIVVSDFDGDGVPDLAVGHEEFAGKVSVRLGKPSGGFAAEASYSAGAAPGLIAVGDFNDDGDPDLAAGNVLAGGTVSVLLGGPGGTFGAPTSYRVGDFPTSVAVADFTGDGDPDLVVTNGNDSTVSLLRGGPGGSFGPQSVYRAGAYGSQTTAATAADFDLDGDLDLVVSNFNVRTLAVLLGAPNGTLGAPTTYPIAGNAESLAVGDFNGDGDPDLAAAGGLSVWVLLGGSGSSFGAPTTLPVGAGAARVAVGDVDRDGDPDLVVANCCLTPGTISVLPGGPGGGFGPPVSFPSGPLPLGLAVADVDLDGALDVAVANYLAGTVSVLRNTSHDVSVDPASIAYPSTPAGDQSVARTVTLTNSSVDDLVIGAVTLGGDHPRQFTIVDDACSGRTLPTDATCTVDVRFAPTAVGPHHAALRFTDDAPDSPQAVELSGTATGPVTVSPASITWAPRPDHTPSSYQLVTLTNASHHDVTVTGASLTGPDASSFRLPTTYDGCTDTTLAGGATCSVKARFYPDGVGTKTAAITFADNAPGSPPPVALTGTATAAGWLTRSTQALKYGHWRVGQRSPTQTVTLTNAGTAPLAITAITLQGDNAADFPALTQTCTQTTSLSPGQSCTATIAFQPTATGARSAYLALTHTAPAADPTRVDLAGTGT